jgi:hypothetical protein
MRLINSLKKSLHSTLCVPRALTLAANAARALGAHVNDVIVLEHWCDPTRKVYTLHELTWAVVEVKHISPVSYDG